MSSVRLVAASRLATGSVTSRLESALGEDWSRAAPTGRTEDLFFPASPPLVDPEAWGLLLKAAALIALSAFGSYTGSALTEAARRVVQYR